jgi:cytochrome c oxidase assembly protein subunit 15
VGERLRANTLKWLAYITCIGMMLVLLNGALVTKTGSGQGCGTDWPLCHGKFVPAYTISSMIEYSHRAVSGLVGILVLVLFIAVWKYAKDRKDAWWYALTALIFTFIQAIMGALAVVLGQAPAVMALHYGFSLIAFAGTLLLSIVLYRRSKGLGDKTPQGVVITNWFRNLTWIVTLYSYMVVYVGAFVRHTEAYGGCQGWPLCNGEIIPTLQGTTLIAFVHRVAALLLFIAVAALAHFAYYNHKQIREMRLAGICALVLVTAQILSGAWVVFTLGNDNIGLFAGLLHTVLIAGLFGILCYMSVRVWQLGKR